MEDFGVGVDLLSDLHAVAIFHLLSHEKFLCSDVDINSLMNFDGHGLTNALVQNDPSRSRSSPRWARFAVGGGVFLYAPHRFGWINLLVANRTGEVFERRHRILFALKVSAPGTLYAANC